MKCPKCGKSSIKYATKGDCICIYTQYENGDIELTETTHHRGSKNILYYECLNCDYKWKPKVYFKERISKTFPIKKIRKKI